MSRKPKLKPPCSLWIEDLPNPNEQPLVTPVRWFNTPNHLDKVFLELPRQYEAGRGIEIWLLPVVSLSISFMWWLLIFDWRAASELGPLIFPTTLCLLWLSFIMWRTEVESPRDFPLRFNRTRQRVYAYNFSYRKWNPFECWSVTPVAYDWSQVRAELWRGYYSSEGVVLSIVKPGTNEVIDRFPLSATGWDAHIWTCICIYMQQGPDALPPPDPPKDPNDVHWYNIAQLLAPEVKWPLDMDRESRTAP